MAIPGLRDRFKPKFLEILKILTVFRGFSSAYATLLFDCECRCEFNHFPCVTRVLWARCSTSAACANPVIYCLLDCLFDFFLLSLSLLLGMEIYSTTLWHLQNEVALSALAQDLVETDRTSPQVRTGPFQALSRFRSFAAPAPNVNLNLLVGETELAMDTSGFVSRCCSLSVILVSDRLFICARKFKPE